MKKDNILSKIYILEHNVFVFFLGLDMNEEEMKDLFERFDTDGSGSINVTEFLQGVRVSLGYIILY